MKTLLPLVGAFALMACGAADARRAPSPPPSPIASAAPIASATRTPTTPAAPTPAIAFASPHGVALPSVAGPVSLDYIAYEPNAERVWIPVGNDGSVDVYDIAKGSFVHVAGFPKVEREVRGKKRFMGPSAATVGEGIVYVGDRASSEVCVVDAKTLARGRCVKLKDAIDGVTYIPTTKEVWVTTPDARAIAVFDASKPKTLEPTAVVHVDGAPEGYAFDASRGAFFTNLEDADKTVTIDVATHAVTHVWDATCGGDGPRGIAIDAARNLVFVGCTDHVQVLDAAKDGAALGKLDVGAGIDGIEWVPSSQLLYVAAAKVAKMVVVQSSDRGELTAVATVATSEGARNAVVDRKGNAYLADGPHAQLLVVDRSMP